MAKKDISYSLKPGLFSILFFTVLILFFVLSGFHFDY